MKNKIIRYRFACMLLISMCSFAQGPWSAPANAGPVVNSTLPDFQPAISPDGLSLYFVRFDQSPNDGIMYVAHRATRQDAWGNLETLPATINVAARTKATPFISTDGHWMYFASNRTGTLGQGDLFRSFRSDLSADSGAGGWQTPVSLGATINSTKQEQMGCVFTNPASGLTTIYFNSDRANHTDTFGGGVAQEIYASTMLAGGSFGAATAVAELNYFGATQQHPTCSPDGLEMYFISDRPGGITYPASPDCGVAGQPSLDIWVSTRASTSEPWGAPQQLDAYNASQGGTAINYQCHDGRPALLADGTELYFYSAFRPQNISINFDIYATTRPDTTAPAAPTGHISPAPNLNGWNNSDVEVSFTANGDPGHITTGVAGCTAIITVIDETAAQPVSGTCKDNAGNVSEPSTITVKLDKTSPTVDVTGVQDGATYLLGAVPVPNCISTDALSGLDVNSALSLTGGNANGVGAYTVTCSGVTDRAGNTTSALPVTYAVAYAFSGFSAPIGPGRDFRLGSTIPIKWQLRDGNGNFITSLSSVQSIALTPASCNLGSTDSVDLGITGATGLRYDLNDNQFVFNWQTKGLAAGCYRITLTTDDSTSHSAVLILR